MRPYKPPIPLLETMSILGREAGCHFDPDLVASFLKIAPEASRGIGAATETELQVRLKEGVNAHRPFLHSDEWVISTSAAGRHPSVSPCLDGFTS